MQRLQAFKFQLQPNGVQERTMRRFAGTCRFVYNEALALQKARYERGESKLGYAGLCTLLTEWRKSAEKPWLRDAPTHPLQQAMKDLERAYKNFFAQRAGFPKFKKRGQHDRFRYPDPKQPTVSVPIRGQRRCSWREEHIGAGTPRCSLWRGRQSLREQRNLKEAGTRRSDCT
jgi:transposase